MVTDIHARNRDCLKPLRHALCDYEPEVVRDALRAAFRDDAIVHLAYPFEDLPGADGFFEQALSPLHQAMPDLECRDTIVMAGETANGGNWVGCAGYYTGTFVRPWLDIPPTGHQVAMRFHEFFRIEDGKVAEMQALWDIPELMMQAGAWPMAPSLGREWQVPGPATQDGILSGPRNELQSEASVRLVSDMLAALGNFSTGGVEAMRLADYWHPRFNWYGPSGIGSSRGAAGFRNWHQIPFLNAMPDRVGSLGKGNLLGDGEYVGFTAWPGMHMTISGDGWLGIAPSNQRITMRSLDFWRCENGLIRENWVLVDLLDVYRQIGVDVLARMREFNKARAYSPANSDGDNAA
jgi:predicted ester cyclase